MATAYTPGLTVADGVVIRKERRLPIKGRVLVSEGEEVEAEAVVAEAELPGEVVTIRVAEQLGCDPSELPSALKKGEGDPVEEGEVIAETRALFGLLRQRVKAPCSGTIEYVSPVTGHIGIRKPPERISVDAYVKGVVAEVIPDEGAVVETKGAMVQGIFGVGGERRGRLTVLDGVEVLTPEDVPEDCQGAILVVRTSSTAEALKLAGERGAVGAVMGSILDGDLREYVGRDIGVAVTGDEDVPLALVVTEGFGRLPMSDRAYGLLKELEGLPASMSGATQIRAGVIRPEVIVPHEVRGEPREARKAVAQELKVGSLVRVIREPHFGKIGRVVSLPVEPILIETGSKVRAAEVEFPGGERVVVPRANLEILE
ncbi:MAG TPA: hypothetical protein EYP65_04835, partial [Armatimonadetes bacterium]|nr:hypothetical protein [Armatimonadota bacterium]